MHCALPVGVFRVAKSANLAIIRACSQSLSSLSASSSPANFDTEAPLGTSALLMVEQAVVVLENEVHFNAGLYLSYFTTISAILHEPGSISITKVIFLS